MLNLPPSTIGVLVGRDLIGDALMKLPFVRALRNAWPEARITWITTQGPTAYAGPLRQATETLIDTVEETPTWLERGPMPHFDLLFDTRNRWKLALAARRISHRTFVAMAMRYMFSDLRPHLFQPQPVHIVDRLLQMVELAAGYIPLSTGALPVSDDIMMRARHILPEGRTYVGLAPGAGNIDKIWPRYKFEKLAELQAAKSHVPVFILGPQELDWYDELSAVIPRALFPLQDYAAWGTAQLTINHTLAVARCLNVAVANDSGVGHMLAAADCPLISLFGPTSPAKLAPRVSRSRIITAQSFGDARMKAITWEAVDAAVDGMLEGK